MAVGLKDIAADLNVSVSMVSKVLSGRLGTSGASEKLTQAIHRRAKELGYQRNHTAAALASGRHGAIGVFIHRLGARGSGVIEELLRGVTESTTDKQLRLCMSFFGTDEEFLDFHAAANVASVDGLIVGGVAHPALQPELLAIQKLGIPVITVHSGNVHADIPNVGVDQPKLLELSTHHLFEQGCRKLAMVTAESARRKGFHDAHNAHGVETDGDLIYKINNYEYEGGVEAATHWLDQGLTFDGVVCQSDQQALGVLHVMVRKGIDVPGEVKVIGVDNSAPAECAIVPLSSVSENYSDQGRVAVSMLADAIDGKTVTSQKVPPTLHTRASTGKTTSSDE